MLSKVVYLSKSRRELKIEFSSSFLSTTMNQFKGKKRASGRPQTFCYKQFHASNTSTQRLPLADCNSQSSLLFGESYTGIVQFVIISVLYFALLRRTNKTTPALSPDEDILLLLPLH